MSAGCVGAHGSAPACSALTPSPSLTAWERGACIAYFGVLKRQLQQRRKLSLPHSTIPLARQRERDKGGEGNNKCLCVGFSTCPPSQPPPWTGEEPRLPPRPRGGLGWGLCSNLTAKTLTNRASKVHYLPPSFRFPSRSGGNRARVRFPLQAGGTLRRGSSLSLVFANYGCVIGIIPTARPECAFTPLLQVPPATRGEPRGGGFVAASRGEPSRASVRFPLPAGGTCQLQPFAEAPLPHSKSSLARRAGKGDKISTALPPSAARWRRVRRLPAPLGSAVRRGSSARAVRPC